MASRRLLVGRKIIFMLNLQQNRKNAFDKIPEIFANRKQSSYEVTLLMRKNIFVCYPTDLVNTKTTIPLRVGEQRWI